MSKFKAFGLALLAICAISAVAAQGAMATNHTFVSGAEKTIITGHGKDHVFKATGIAISCETAQFAGTVVGNAQGESDHVTVHPHYSGDCTVVGTGVEVEVDTKGCVYTFDSDTTPTGVDEEHAAVTIACEEGHEITVTAPGCTIHVTPQTVDGIRYDNEGSGSTADVKVTATVKGITYTVTEEGFCFLLGLEGSEEGTEHHDGTYEGVATVKGYTDNGVHGNTTDGLTGLEFTEGSQVGIQLETP